MKKNTLWLIVILSFLITFVTRYPTRSRYLYHWDSVQFALAMNEFDISKGQPHAPGYVLYVYLGKLFRIFARDDNLSFVLLNLTLAALSQVLVFCFAFYSSSADSKKRAWIAWLLTLTNVLFWFYTDVALIYVAE